MIEANRRYLSAQELFDEVQPIGNVLGLSIEKKDFINHLPEFYKFNQKYHDVVNLYVFKHSEQLKDLTDTYMQTEHITLNLAMIKARQQLIAEAQQKIVKNELHVFYPNYLKKQIISNFKKDYFAKPACSTDDILNKISGWKDAYTNTILGEQRSKTLLRRSNSEKLKIIMDDLKISPKDGERFRMALSRYKGTLNSFLNDFGKQQVPFFHSSAKVVCTENDNSVNTTMELQPVDEKHSAKDKKSLFSIKSFRFPALAIYTNKLALKACKLALKTYNFVLKKVRKLTLKKRIACGYKKITMACKSFFYWLQNHKKIHKIKRINFNFDWRNKIKPTPMPAVKIVFLKNHSQPLKVAAIMMPFIGLGYFGHKLISKAKATSPLVDVRYNIDYDSISPIVSSQAQENFAQLNNFCSLPVVENTSGVLEPKLKEQKNKETTKQASKEAKKQAKKEAKEQKAKQKALTKENKKKAKGQSAKQVTHNNTCCVDGINMDLQPLKSSNVRLSSRFGLRKDPFSGRTRMHYGVDYAAPYGSPVYACADGVVQSASWVRGYGQYIVIKHNNTYSSAYAHMSRFADKIKPGVEVTFGQIVGYVGSTGRSTGTHLHFEVKKNGKNIDPFILANSRELASR